MNALWSHSIAIIIAAILVAVGGTGVKWYTEPYPYEYLRVSIDTVRGDDDIITDIELFRTKLCPYYIERQLRDSKNHKVLDSRKLFSTPTELGAREFSVPIAQKDLTGTISKGTAVYKVRILPICNPLHYIFPYNAPWITTNFYVLK